MLRLQRVAKENELNKAPRLPGLSRSGKIPQARKGQRSQAL
jgi:hypothetical protein